ncbi:MAG: MlaD family protein [Gammaproteobacteria bacterium]|jgi:phospholipid/cholesterol/gamma-HCH transport system substrate-binding protein|nr:MlaD family protein [Gammaproteobacteria bacterium]
MTQRTHALATGLFLAILGAGVLVAFLWLRGGIAGGRVYELVSHRGSASGLYPGAPVTERGLTVGHVVALRLRGYPPSVVVKIRLHPGVRVGVGTRAFVTTSLFGGGGSLALVPPTHGPYRPLTAPSGRPPRIPLVASARGRLLHNLSVTAAELRLLGSRLDRLLDPQTLRSVSVFTRESARTSRHLARLSAEADRALPLLVTRVNSLIVSSRALARSLRNETQSLHHGTRRLETTLLLRTLPETDASLRALARAARAWSRFGARLDHDPQILFYGRRFARPKPAAHPQRGGPQP